MSQNANIQFSFAGLPEGYCFEGFDRYALDIVNNMSGFIPGQYSVIIDSETEPDVDDREKLWHKLLPGGAPSGKFYKYYLGKWVSPNPIEALSQERKWWAGSEADAWAYDGGDGTDPASVAPTATTGAMWEEDENYRFRFPLGAGSSPKPTTVVPGDTGGAEEVELSINNLPEHTHAVATTTNAVNGSVNLTGSDYIAKWGGSNEGAYTLAPEPGDLEPTLGKTGLTGAAAADLDAVNNMPPYRVGLWLKRTARAYYTA